MSPLLLLAVSATSAQPTSDDALVRPSPSAEEQRAALQEPEARLGAGSGLSERGTAGRLHADEDVWINDDVALAGRVDAGLDGRMSDMHRSILLVEPGLSFKLTGGRVATVVFRPSIGAQRLPTEEGPLDLAATASVILGVQSNPMPVPPPELPF